MDYKKLYSDMAHGLKASAIRELLKITARPEVISFAGGLPDSNLFPEKEVAEALQEVMATTPREALQYGTTEGQMSLKKELISLLKSSEDIDALPEQLLVVSASQQGLDMTARVFLNRGDAVITATPTYLGALQAFTASGADIYGASSDENGVLPSAIEARLKELQTAGKVCKFIYLVPDFQNPNGLTIPEERRLEILKLAEKYGTLIVEDSPYRQIRFEGKASKTFYKLDEGRGNVITLFTFSKIFVPGFRLGYVLAPEEVIKKYVILKQAMDLCTPAVVQLATACYLRKGHLVSHIQEVVEVYRQKRDMMLQKLAEYMPQGVSWTKPEGGLFLWVTLPEQIDSSEMLHTSLQQNVAYVAGDSFYPPRDVKKNHLRLNFSYSTPQQIEEGVKRLATTIKQLLAK